MKIKTLLLAFALLFSMQTAFAIDSDGFTSPTPTSDFINNGDGTVTHKKSGLMWMRCAIGQTWTDSSCAGNPTKYTYEQAMALNSNFADKSDWRLPNIDELLSIVDKGKKDPAINSTIFPNTLTNPGFWSSSPYGSSVLFLDFHHGNSQYIGEDYSYFVRLVRGGQWFSGHWAVVEKYEKASQLAKELKCKDALKLDREAQQLERTNHSDHDRDNGYYINYSYCESERNFKSQLSGKNPQAMYLAAGKYERDGSSDHAKELYEAIIARFPSSVWAVKANDQLLQNDRVSDIESSNASAASRVESDSRRLAYEQCKVAQDACYSSGRKNCYRDCKSLK